MYKLIMHHSYQVMGEAFDLSGSANHGFRTSVTFQPDGRSPGTGALSFAGGASSINVRNSAVWSKLAALKIEAWVFMTALAGQRRNIVEGDSTFAFFIESDGTLMGTYHGLAGSATAPAWVGARSNAAGSPDGNLHTVPLNQWVKLTYLHDGIATIRLYMDDQLVAINTTLRSGIKPVGPLGVFIGHWTGDGRYTFSGLIDDVKIWKYDPDVPQHEFYCRPMEAEQIDCWGRLFEMMVALMDDRENRERFRGYILCLTRAQNNFIRAIRSKGEAVIKELDKLSARYLELWCAGNIDGPEMRDFVVEWMAWVETVAPGALDAYQRQINDCIVKFKMQEILVKLGSEIAECDPLFAKLIQNVMQEIGQPPANNPIQVASVSPTQITAGTGGTLTILGANFTNATTVELQGVATPLSVTMIGASELHAVVPAAVPAGTYTIRVSDPAGGSNTAFTLNVVARPRPPFWEDLIRAILDLIKRLFGRRS
jgi:hypothetical protein